METLRQSAHELQTLLKPVVDLLVKETRPKDDVLTLNKAYDIYGRRWVDHHIKAENLIPVKCGGRKILSKAECSCLWAVEHAQPSIVTDQPRG